MTGVKKKRTKRNEGSTGRGFGKAKTISVGVAVVGPNTHTKRGGAIGEDENEQQRKPKKIRRSTQYGKKEVKKQVLLSSTKAEPRGPPTRSKIHTKCVG